MCIKLKVGRKNSPFLISFHFNKNEPKQLNNLLIYLCWRKIYRFSMPKSLLLHKTEY